MKDGNGGITYSTLVTALDSEVVQYNRHDSIRPIVYLKANLRTTGKGENGAWIISE